MQLADYSSGRPTGAQLKAAQFGGVVRYIGLGSAGKRLTAAEYRNLVAEGLEVYLVAELGTNDSWGSSTDDDYARGRANAAAALADARVCGVPDNEIFVFGASDAHASAQWQIDDTVDYIRGFRDVLGLGRTGHYGFVETQTAVRKAGVASGFWRCGSEPSAADKQWVHLWQRNKAPTVRVVGGVTCDINELYRFPTAQEDDMTDAQVQQILTAIATINAKVDAIKPVTDLLHLQQQRYTGDQPNGEMKDGVWSGDFAEVARMILRVVQGMPEQLNKLTTGGIDVDQLATQISLKITAPQIDADALAKAVNDEFARRQVS
ncbi:glycoside hydrolase domain-containing protein [Amycolatopsis sp. NPDC004368]